MTFSSETWRSMKDDPPKQTGEYIVAIKPTWENSRYTVTVKKYDAKAGRFTTGAGLWVTHWQPLPEAPQEGEDKVCPVNGAPCCECMPGSPCAKEADNGQKE